MNLFVEPKKVALIVIDMQADFYAPDGGAVKRGKLVSKMQSLPIKLNKSIQKVHDKIGLTVFTKYLSGKGITPLNLQRVADKEGYSLMCEQGSGLEEISGILIPKDAVVIKKPHFDAFAYTTLLKILKEHSISIVLVAGVRTEVCVDITAKRAASEGFDTVIIRDLVATYDDKEQVHQNVLSFFDKYYGFVLESSEIEKELRIDKV